MAISGADRSALQVLAALNGVYTNACMAFRLALVALVFFCVGSGLNNEVVEALVAAQCAFAVDLVM